MDLQEQINTVDGWLTTFLVNHNELVPLFTKRANQNGELTVDEAATVSEKGAQQVEIIKDIKEVSGILVLGIDNVDEGDDLFVPEQFKDNLQKALDNESYYETNMA